MSLETRLAKLEAERPAEPLVMIWMNHGESADEARERHYAAHPEAVRTKNEMFFRWLAPDEEGT